MKSWEIIADRLHAEGWSYGIAEHLTKHGLLFCVDAHRDGKRLMLDYYRLEHPSALARAWWSGRLAKERVPHELRCRLLSLLRVKTTRINARER